MKKKKIYYPNRNNIRNKQGIRPENKDTRNTRK